MYIFFKLGTIEIRKMIINKNCQLRAKKLEDWNIGIDYAFT